MKKFESITEKEILYYASHVILEKQLKEVTYLKNNPNAPIALFRKEKYDRQLDEIHAEILKIENNEQ